MKAVVMTSSGGPEVLKVEEREVPQLAADQVLIKAYAAGVNRPDIFQRKGNYAAPAHIVQDILGLEVSGVIEEVGDAVSLWKKGDEVMALVAGAAYAEYVAVHEGSVLPKPASISFEAAAGIPETVYTVWHNVFQRGQLKPKERLLVHGGSGGIGSTAIQLAKLFGAEVICTVGSAEKADYAKSLGADQVINYKEEDFEELLRTNKVDVILDCIGGDYFAKNINVIKEEGRLVYINAMQGAKVELNLLKLMQKRIQLTGSTLRNRSDEFKATLTKEIKEQVLPKIADKQFLVPIQQVYSYREAAEAHRLMESRDFMGKIILSFL